MTVTNSLCIPYITYIVYSIQNFTQIFIEANVTFFSSSQNDDHGPSYTVVYREGPGQERNGENPLGNSERKMGL